MKPRGRARPHLLLLGLLVPASSEAQDSVLQAGLERLRLELAASRDTEALRRMEHDPGLAGGIALTEPGRRLARALVRLRLGALGDGWSLRRASGDLDAVLADQPGWGWVWYLKGLAKRGESAWLANDRANLGTRVGMGQLKTAVECLARSAVLDSGLSEALVEMTAAAEALRDTTVLGALVLPALRRAGPGTGDTGIALALGRAERLMGDPAAAVAAVDRYLDLGGNRARGLLERAASRLASGDLGGAEDYFAGAALDDSTTVAAYRADLELIARPEEMAEFDAVRGGERAAFLRRFWIDRDHLDLRAPGDRIREHYRRIAYAQRHFALLTNRRQSSAGSRFDDRGLVYVRFGQPDLQISTVTFGIGPNASWRYHRADGDLLLHFGSSSNGLRGGDLQDYRLVPSVLALPIDTRAGDAPLVLTLQARCEMYQPYCKLLNWGPYGQRHLIDDETRVVASSIWIATSSDGFELRFAHPLITRVAALAVGAQGDRSLVHLVYAVPIERPPDATTGSGLRIAIRARANLFDAAGRSAGAIDTTTVAVIAPPNGAEAGERKEEATRGTFDAVGRVALAVPRGRYYYRLALQVGDSTGRVQPTDSVTVGAFAGPRLALSDLVLGLRERSAAWSPVPSDTAFFAPVTALRAEEPVELYYEVYGLAPETAFESRLTIFSGKRPVNVTVTQGQSAGPVTRVSRTLSMAALPPGRYRLELEVRTADGASAVSGRSFAVRQPEGSP